MRKIIALLLAAAMAFSLVIVAGATEETTKQTAELKVTCTDVTADGVATFTISIVAPASGVAALQFTLEPEGMTYKDKTLENLASVFKPGIAGVQNGDFDFTVKDGVGKYIAYGGDANTDRYLSSTVQLLTVRYQLNADAESGTLTISDFKACQSGSQAMTNPYNCEVVYEDGTATPTPTTYSIEAVGKNENTPQYTLNGTDLTVTYSAACAVGYSTDNGQTYTRIKATSGSGNSYVYDLSSVPTNAQIIVVVKGDANGDGTFTNRDSTKVKAVLLGKSTMDAKQSFAADVNSDGKFTNRDSTKMKAVLLGKSLLSWDSE